MRTTDFEYILPPALIAQKPLVERVSSRLMVVNRTTSKIEHRTFNEILDYLRAGDCLVVNETKVRPARLLGNKTTGAAIELLLLTEVEPDLWDVLCRPAKRLPIGSRLLFDNDLTAEIVDAGEAGKRTVKFHSDRPISKAIHEAGQVALPPYITEELKDSSRYQTVFASKPGSVAAPTAGLHFTDRLVAKIKDAGVSVAKVTLDIGLDTFRPIAAENIEDHIMHSESYEVTKEAAETINKSRLSGGRVIAVGTTSVRVLESVASEHGDMQAASGRTRLFIKPGYKFKIVDIMLTNFHLPKSSLLVLVSTFAGAGLVKRAYNEAINERYRFYSFGDAMLLID